MFGRLRSGSARAPHDPPPAEDAALPGRILAVANQKGGVGKTTTAVNLGAALAELGARVLLVDIDPQGNATSGLGVDRRRVERSVYDVLLEGVPAAAAVRQTSVPGLWLLPSTLDLAGAELELGAAASREARLREALAPLRAEFSWLLIDCPPSLGLLTLNALVAADGVLVPIQCEYYALEGVGQLVNTIQGVRRNMNPQLQIEGIVLTMFDGRTNLSLQVAEEVRRAFRREVFKTLVPRNVRLSEAPSHGVPISVYDPRSRGAQVYEALAKEVVARARSQAQAGTGA
jgi:chromosome partitioning protein